MGSPAISTFLSAAEHGFLDCLPNLTVQKIRKNRPNSIATSKGHLDQTRKNYRSTKQRATNKPDPIVILDPDQFPTEEISATHLVYTKLERTHRNFMDSTGKFPVKSRSGHEYILLMYDYDTNYLHFEPMRPGKNRLLEAYKQGTQFLTAQGHKPQYQRLDNETSKELEEYMHIAQISFQYVPPNSHRRNPAERGIRTAKNHLIATLCTADPAFPLNLWDTILPQSELTLNLLRGSRLNTSQSAWAAMQGPYDFNAHPLAPIGIRVVIHEKPVQRASWAPHGIDGFYLGPASDHYRCYRCWSIDTQRERITDTVAWHPQDVIMPGASETEVLTNAILDLQQTLSDTANDVPLSCKPTLTELHEMVAKLYPPVQKPPATPLLQLLTHTRAANTVLKDAFPPHLSTTSDREQRVVSINADQIAEQSPADQRVVESVFPLGTNEKVPNATPEQLPLPSELPGKIFITPGGDNLTYTQHCKNKRRRSKHKLENTTPRRNQSEPSSPAANEAENSSTHLQGWRVHSVIAHRGKIAHRSKLQFKVLWHPLANGTVSPATWLPWKQAKDLDLIKEYISTIPLMHYLLRYSTADPVPQPQFANSTTGLDGQPLRYNALMRGPQAAEWEEAHACEFDRLLETTSTMRFIHPHEKPDNRLASYYNPQCSIKHGTDKRIRGTYGGDHSDYVGDVSANTASLETVNIMLNATISEEDSHFTTADIKDFFLMTNLARPEFMWVPVRQIPARIQHKYNVAQYTHNERALVQIDKSIYGLPQAALLAKTGLDAHLAEHDYHETSTACLYKHKTRPIMFTLVVDDFGIKAKGDQHREHLLRILRLKYDIKVGDGSKYLGITLEWDYKNRTVAKSMPDHLRKNLHRFNVQLLKPQYSPGGYVQPIYGSRAQQYATTDTSTLLTSSDKTRIQEIVGTFLYYARVIDSTMLKKLNELSSEQAHATEAVKAKAELFLQYAATYPTTKVVYHASDMIYYQHSDASYLGETKARSRAGGIGFLGQSQTAPASVPTSPINGLLTARSSILDVVVSSAAEAELGALFENMRDGTTIRAILSNFGYPQPSTPIQTDNACAHGIANDKVKLKRSKAFDMRYYWVRDRVKQDQFTVYWREGGHNLADYLTKDHPAKHHRAMRPFFVSS